VQSVNPGLTGKWRLKWCDGLWSEFRRARSRLSHESNHPVKPETKVKNGISV